MPLPSGKNSSQPSSLYPERHLQHSSPVHVFCFPPRQPIPTSAFLQSIVSAITSCRPRSLLPLKPPHHHFKAALSCPALPCPPTKCGTESMHRACKLKPFMYLLHWALFCPLNDAVSSLKTPGPIVARGAGLEGSYMQCLGHTHIHRYCEQLCVTTLVNRSAPAFCQNLGKCVPGRVCE